MAKRNPPMPLSPLFGVPLKGRSMNLLRMLRPPLALAKRSAPASIGGTSTWLATATATLLCLISAPAHAVDGCKVLLCLAAPSWRSIPECVPTINQLHWDLAHGKAFPDCSMSGAGNSANNAWASAPANCPPQYTHVVDGESAPIYSCDYSGVVTVIINGATFTRTWWSVGGDTSTEFTPLAKFQLGTWDSKFDLDYAAWLAAQPAPTQSCTSC